MPEEEVIERAKEDKREGKSPSTQAGEFVREEIHHLREGKHGARSTKQAIAIGLSKARRAVEAEAVVEEIESHPSGAGARGNERRIERRSFATSPHGRAGTHSGGAL